MDFFEHISHDSKSLAKLFVEKIYYRVDQLRHFPLSGRKVPEVDNPKIRELTYKNYRIVYYSQNKELVRILTVFHSSKNFDDTQLPEQPSQPNVFWASEVSANSSLSTSSSLQLGLIKLVKR